MAVTFALVFAGANNLRYLVTASGAGSGTLPSSGGATPDFQTDTVAGPLKAIATAQANGYGTVAAGAITQAQAQAMLLADGAAASIGNVNIVRARCLLTPFSGTAAWSVDANQTAGNPTAVVTADAAGSAFLDIAAIGAIGA